MSLASMLAESLLCLSVFHLPSSIFRLPSSVFHLPLLPIPCIPLISPIFYVSQRSFTYQTTTVSLHTSHFPPHTPKQGDGGDLPATSAIPSMALRPCFPHSTCSPSWVRADERILARGWDISREVSSVIGGWMDGLDSTVYKELGYRRIGVQE